MQQAIGAGDVDADYAFARKIADESMKPGHEYSPDEDTYPADALDPRSNIYDLGADPAESRNAIDTVAAERKQEWRLRVLPGAAQSFSRL